MSIHPRATIWFDIENTPHAWILKEFIYAFEALKMQVVVTARNFYSTVDMCSALGLNSHVVGKKANGNSNIIKLLKVIQRSFALSKYISQKEIHPTIAVSHGSRSQALAAHRMRIPAISLDDYEHSFRGFNRYVTNILSPQAIEKEAWGVYSDKVVQYPGLKEELYLWNQTNIGNEKLDCIKPDAVNIVFRPGCVSSHYQTDHSFQLEKKIMHFISQSGNAHVILMARDSAQAVEFHNELKKRNISHAIPGKILNGPSLISQSDLVIGGGGTMMREASVLRVPSYSYFGGTEGSVDRYLEKQNLLKYIRSDEDRQRIRIEKRNRASGVAIGRQAFDFVMSFLLDHLHVRNGN